MTTQPQVDILYFDGCPNWERTNALVEEIAGELGLKPAIRRINVPDAEAAAQLRFLGSPTVRVDGLDVEPSADKRHEFMLACRVYRTEHGLAGQPDPAWIRSALERAAAR